jgi:type IV secretion system protein VirB9
MKTCSATHVALFIIALSTLALSPMRSDAENRLIRSVKYDATQVFRIRGWVGYHIDLEFEQGETFSSLGGGDLGALSYGAFENHLVLKPTAANIRTNLTVITSRRTYIFDYVVDSGVPNPSTDDLVYSLRFTYTPVPAVGGLPTQVDTVSKDLKGAEATRVRNYDYWFCGDVSLQPIEASDDGVHTRLRFSPSAEIPAFFVRSDDGTESLLNFSVDLAQGDVIVHRTVRKLILRRGKLTGCVVNKSYSGAGERMETGTISPAVSRDAPGVRP